MTNAFYMQGIKINRAAKGEAGQNGDFVGGINTVNVKGWISLV